MALIQPSGPQWGYCTSSLSGTPSATVNGTAITAGTSNANGTAVALLTALTHDVEYLVLGFSGFTVATAVNRTQIDVMIDPAGGSSWDTTNLLIPDLIVGGTPTVSATIGPSHRFHFPIYVKSGASIGVRARTSHTVAAGSSRVFATAFGGNKSPTSWWCGQKVTAIGTTTASSSGQSHTTGNTGAFSSWTSLGSTTPLRAGAVVWGVQSQLTAHAARGYRFEFGAGSTMIGYPVVVTVNTSEQCSVQSLSSPIFVDIPAATQLQVRGTSSGTAEAMDVAAYIVS